MQSNPDGGLSGPSRWHSLWASAAPVHRKLERNSGALHASCFGPVRPRTPRSASTPPPPRLRAAIKDHRLRRVSDVSLHVCRGQRQASGELPLRPSPRDLALHHEPLHALRARPQHQPLDPLALNTRRRNASGSGCRPASPNPNRSGQLLGVLAAVRSERFQSACWEFTPLSPVDRPTALLAEFSRELSACATRPTGSHGFDPDPSRSASALRSAERSPATTALQCCGRRMRALKGAGLDPMPGFRGALAVFSNERWDLLVYHGRPALRTEPAVCLPRVA